MPYNDIFVYEDVIGGTGDGSSEANARSSFNINDIAHGTKIWIKEGAAPTTIPNWTSILTPIVEGVPLFCIEGYHTTPGDGGIVSVDMYSGADIFTGQGRPGWTFINIHSVGDEAFGGILRSGTDGTSFINCSGENTSVGASNQITGGSTVTIPHIGCYVKAAGANGPVQQGPSIGNVMEVAGAVKGAEYAAGYNPLLSLYNVFLNKSGSAIKGLDVTGIANMGTSIVAHNTFVGFPDGIRLDGLTAINATTMPVFHGNLFSDGMTGISHTENAANDGYIAMGQNAEHNLGANVPMVSLGGDTNLRFSSASFADTKKGIISFVAEKAGAFSSGYLFSGGWGRFFASVNNLGRIVFQVQGKTQGTLWSLNSSDKKFDVFDRGQVITFVWDTTQGFAGVYKGKELIASKTDVADDLVDYSGSFFIGSREGGSEYFSGSMGDFYLALDHSFDLSGGGLSPADLALFVSDNGQRPSGAGAPSPLILLDGDATFWAAGSNSGSAGAAHTATGTFAAADDISPLFGGQMLVKAGHVVGVPSSPFVDPANDDYRLNDVAGGGAELSETMFNGFSFGALGQFIEPQPVQVSPAAILLIV